MTTTDTDLAAESERLAFLRTCTAFELDLMLGALVTEPEAFDGARGVVERLRENLPGGWLPSEKATS